MLASDVVVSFFFFVECVREIAIQLVYKYFSGVCQLVREMAYEENFQQMSEPKYDCLLFGKDNCEILLCSMFTF